MCAFLSVDDASIIQIQQDIIKRFEVLDDWTFRYQYLIDIGRDMPDFPEQWKQDNNLLRGCQAQVWMHSKEKDGKLYFFANSDSAIVQGLLALLLQVYSGRYPKEILENPPNFIKDIKLEQHLSPYRANGLVHMLERIRTIAKAYVEN